MPLYTVFAHERVHLQSLNFKDAVNPADVLKGMLFSFVRANTATLLTEAGVEMRATDTRNDGNALHTQL